MSSAPEQTDAFCQHLLQQLAWRRGGSVRWLGIHGLLFGCHRLGLKPAVPHSLPGCLHGGSATPSPSSWQPRLTERPFILLVELPYSNDILRTGDMVNRSLTWPICSERRKELRLVDPRLRAGFAATAPPDRVQHNSFNALLSCRSLFAFRQTAPGCRPRLGHGCLRGLSKHCFLGERSTRISAGKKPNGTKLS